MKKRNLYLVAALLITILLCACDSDKKMNAIVLPSNKEVSAISIEHKGETVTYIDEKWISEFLSMLRNMEITDKVTIQDVPLETDFMTINMKCTNDTISTIFFYEENHVSYIEQPYQGIYMSAPELSEYIAEIF